MSRSLKVFGRCAGEKARQFYEVHQACKRAGVETPSEVQLFFKHYTPSPDGVSQKIDDVLRETKNGYVIDLKTLYAAYPDVTAIEVDLS